jgi:hypothetical protein
MRQSPLHHERRVANPVAATEGNKYLAALARQKGLSSPGGPTSATAGEKGIENAPFRVRQIAPTYAASFSKGSLGIIHT